MRREVSPAPRRTALPAPIVAAGCAGQLEMWVLLIIALASPGAPGGGVHSSMTTLQFQTQAVCENAAKTVNQMNVRSAAGMGVAICLADKCFRPGPRQILVECAGHPRKRAGGECARASSLNLGFVA
jgi:hypothetical protein